MAVLTSTGFRTALLGGRGFASIFNNGVIQIRSGAQPTSADAAPTGALLGTITNGGGAWSPGNPTAGLRFVQNRQFVTADPMQHWVITGSATGTAGWFRLLPSQSDPGTESSTAPRIDGAVGLLDSTADVQMYLPTLSISPATTIVMPDWWYAMPPM